MSLENWDNYSGQFLKIDDIKGKADVGFICTDVKEVQNKQQSITQLEFMIGQTKKLLDLNKTLVSKLIELGMKTPRMCLGRKFFFVEGTARNPKLNTDVPVVRIARIE